MHTHASINRIYRLVWSAVFQTWVVASELARGRGKSSATPLLSAALAAGLLSLSNGAGAAPQGGQLVGGSGSIGANGGTTTINQTSDKLSINWQSFNVGKNETVNFVQPSASALAVNRILDTQGSQILGKINANGQVWLINPNGVIFGKDAQINVGALLASTLNPDDASIGSARSNFSGSSSAGVVNLGSINAAQGGYVALLGHSVSNSGQISAPGGTVALGAGSAVSLNFAGSKLLGLEVTSNQINALAENGGLIQADGGQVLLSAGARDSLLASVVNNTGIIQARTVQEQDGKIVLLGGMAAGTTHVAGTLDASAPSGGNGGFIETSAHTVNVDDSANITTASAQGTHGQWLLDPYDFYVKSSGGNISGTVLGRALNSNNIIIQTTDTGTVYDGITTTGGTSGSGDIYVYDAVTYTGTYARTLTLAAHHDININAAIKSTKAPLSINLDATAATTFSSTGSLTTNGGDVRITGTGDKTLGTIKTTGADGTGNLTIGGTGAIRQINPPTPTTTSTAFLTIKGKTTLDAGAANDVTLTNTGSNGSGTGNDFIGAVLVTSGKNINITDINALVLGASTASGTVGITIDAGGAITQTGAIKASTLTAKTWNSSGSAITLTDAGNDVSTVNLQARNGTIWLKASGNAGGAISYTGAKGFAISGIGTTNDVTLLAGGAITQTGAIKASTLTAKTLFDAAAGAAAITLTNAGNDAATVNLQARDSKDTANVNAAISYTDANDFNISAIRTTGNVFLKANGVVTQSGAIAAKGLALAGAGGAYTLKHPGNAITTLAANTGSIDYRQSGALAVGTVGPVAGVATTGTTRIETTGLAANLTLNNAVTSRATGDAIILKAGSSNTAGKSTGGQLNNKVGKDGIQTSFGRYLVYSGDPGSTTEGVTGYAKHYNAGVDFDPSGTIASTFFYRIAPTLKVTARGGSKVYDGTAPTLTFDITPNGLIDGDVDVAFSGALHRTGGKDVLRGVRDANAVTQGDLRSQMGYRIEYVGAEYTITPKTLTYTANAATLTTGATPKGLSGTVSGFVGNEDQTTATTGTLKWITPATNASSAGRYAINGSGLSADNYTFSQAETNRTALTLEQAVSRVPVIGSNAYSQLFNNANSLTFALLGQTTQAIDTLPATGAGLEDDETPREGSESVPDVVRDPIQPFGKSGLIYARTNNVKLPNRYP